MKLIGIFEIICIERVSTEPDAERVKDEIFAAEIVSAKI
jgi:hypothetical protein